MIYLAGAKNNGSANDLPQFSCYYCYSPVTDKPIDDNLKTFVIVTLGYDTLQVATNGYSIQFAVQADAYEKLYVRQRTVGYWSSWSSISRS